MEGDGKTNCGLLLTLSAQRASKADPSLAQNRIEREGKHWERRSNKSAFKLPWRVQRKKKGKPEKKRMERRRPLCASPNSFGRYTWGKRFPGGARNHSALVPRENAILVYRGGGKAPRTFGQGMGRKRHRKLGRPSKLMVQGRRKDGLEGDTIGRVALLLLGKLTKALRENGEF